VNFKQQKQIERLFPAADHWEWLEGTKYRIKQLKKSAWYGLQLFEFEDRITAKLVLVFKRNCLDLIQIDIPFLSIKDVIDHFENEKNRVLKLADSSTKVLKIQCTEIVNIKA
jgi:hypothetical protein